MSLIMNKNMLKKMFRKIKRILTVDKYYKMDDEQLELNAHKWNIRGYVRGDGNINRQEIIDAIIKKNKANDSRLAIFISIIALFASIIALLV